MTDEEKQAIGFLKEYQDKPPFIIWKDNTPYNKKIQSQIIVNLIEKQSKEIEELKEKNEKLERKIKRVLIYLDYIDDDMMKCCSIIDVNGIDIVKILNEE